MHIEPTSRCVLSCPGCSRTWFTETLNRSFPKQDLDLDALARFLDCDGGLQVNEFLVNGNHGDPIYYPRLIEMIKRFRDRRFKISTNGSYMSEQFWRELSDNLGPNDTIYFSIDGLKHDNHLYRRNSDWDSIMRGLTIMSNGPARVIWKSIIFSYNQDEQEQMAQMAQDLGVEFFSEPTGYFGDESLKPTDINLVRTDMFYENSKDASDLDPMCRNGRTEFVSADGYYWPCCLISTSQFLYKMQLWRDRDQWRIDTQNLDQARKKIEQWADLVQSQGKNAPSPCKMHCKTNQKTGRWTLI